MDLLKAGRHAEDVYQKVDAAQLAANAPTFVLHHEEAGGNGLRRGAKRWSLGALRMGFLVFSSLMVVAGGALYYFYHKNETVKGKVDVHLLHFAIRSWTLKLYTPC